MKNTILYITLLFIISACHHTSIITIGDLSKQEPIILNAFTISKVKKSFSYDKPSETDSSFTYQSDMDIIDFEDVGRKNHISNADGYQLTTDLTCGASQLLYLMYGSTGNLIVWLDDKRIISDTTEPVYMKYGHYVPVYLQKGKHKLLVEINFTTNTKSGKLVMALGSEAYATKRHHELCHQSFLTRSVLQHGDSLHVNMPFKTSDSILLEIWQNNTSLRRQYLTNERSFALAGLNLKEGVYDCKLQAYGDVYDQPFVVGNADSLFRLWQKELRKNTRDSFYSQYISPAVERFQYLTKYKMQTGQRVAYFGVSLSADEIVWIPPVKAESKATSLDKGTLKIDKKPYQYVQIWGYGNSFHSWNAISEVKIWGGDVHGGESRELVLAGIIASSFEGVNYPANVNDNNVSTCWESASEGDWIRFDLQNPYRIDSIQIAWKKDAGTLSKVASHEKEIAACLWQINAMITDLTDKKEPVRNKGGKWLHGYYSPTDMMVKQYLVQAPERIDSSFHYPLIIHIVPRVETPAPLASSYLMGSAEVDRMNYEAKKRHLIDVWSFLDNYDGIMFPSGAVHYSSLLKQLQLTYPIDTSRIYLMATCSGSIKAIQLANEFSNSIAAMSFCPSYWDTAGLLKSNSLLYNTRHIPIQAIHSEKDNLTPVYGLYRLIDSMKSVGAAPVNKIINKLSRDFYVADQMSQQLDYLLTHRLAPSPKISYRTAQLKLGAKGWIAITGIEKQEEATITATLRSENTMSIETKNITSFTILPNMLHTRTTWPVTLELNGQTQMLACTDLSKPISIILKQDNPMGPLVKTAEIEGPVNHLYSKSFVCVVAGDQKNINERIVAQFQNLVLKKYVRTFRFMEEKELNEQIAASNHLLIIKTGAAGKLLDGILHKVPLKLSRNGKGFVCIYPNPLNPHKYIVVVDVEGLKVVTKEMADIIMQCNYDYSVFEDNGQAISEIVHGNFTNDWQLKQDDKQLP